MKKGLIRIGTALAAFGTPALALAQTSSIDQKRPLDLLNLQRILYPVQPVGGFNLFTFFSNVFSIVILIAAIIAILYLVWAGIQYITASTDEEKAKKARTAIYNAIIGIVVIILSYAIIVWVGTLVSDQAQNVTGSGDGTNSIPILPQ